MTKSSMCKSVKIALAFISLLMIFQPVLSEELSEQGETKFKGKIFGDELMLIDKMGMKSIAKDGIYTTEDGGKITVENGNISDIPPKFESMGVYSTFFIIDVEYFETN